MERRPSSVNPAGSDPLAAFFNFLAVALCLRQGVLPPPSTTILGAYQTLWTATLLHASHQALLRMVCDVCGKDRVDISNEAVGADHLDAIKSSFHQGLQERAHAVMEQLVACMLPRSETVVACPLEAQRGAR